MGCEPGSITVGLAEVVEPGEVVGIDVQVDVIERARASAADSGCDNVRFEVANLYTVPFPDASFDVCFANSVLQHFLTQ